MQNLVRRLGLRLQALRNWLFGRADRNFLPTRSSSEVLLLEALQVAARRRRPAWARQLLLARANAQLEALVQARKDEKLLGDGSLDLTLLDRAITTLRAAPDLVPSQGADMGTVLAAADGLLLAWSKLLQTLPPALLEGLDEPLDRHLEMQLRGFVVAGGDWQPTNSAGVADVQHVRVHTDAMLGLALSGGGIRSASFSMGALESLAKANLLPGVDVISSVSGGGYAASWLGAWAYRHQDGISGVQKDLYEAAGTSVGPMRWVGRHCAYLAPRLASPLSSDGWSLFVAYVSNWLPILALLSSASLAMLLLPHALVIAAGWLRDTTEAPVRDVALTGSLVIFVLFAGVVRRLMIFHRVPRERSRFPRGLPEVVFYGSLLVTLGIAATLPLLWPAMVGLGARGLAVADAVRYQVAGGANWFPDGQTGKALLVFVGLSVALLAAAMLAFVMALALSTPPAQTVVEWLRKHLLRLDMVAGGRLERIGAPYHRSAAARVVAALLAAGMLTMLAEQVVGPAVARTSAEVMIAVGPLALVFALAVAELAGLMLVPSLQHDRDRAWAARVGGWMLAAAAAWTLLCVLALGTLPMFAWLQHTGLAWPLAAAAGALLLFGWHRFGPAAPACALVVLLFVVALLQLLLQPLLHHAAAQATADARLRWICSLLFMTLLITAVLAALANVNRFSLHALYKQGLVRTFLGASRLARRNPQVAPPQPAPPAEQARQFMARRPDPVTNIDEDDDPALAWLQSGPQCDVPILLLNAAVNGRSPTDLEGRVPRQWPFTFGPYFCGSPAAGVGYARTEDFHAARRGSLAGGKGLSLGTAMAVSGAAMSPTSGRSTHPVRAFILGILNARLGLWIGNPRHPESVASESPPLAGLTVLREMLGVRAKFARWIHLSDGGHFENLGIYELVRRGCRRIVVVDASCDTKRDFADLANAIRRVRIDLGVRIYRVGSWDIHGPDGAPRSSTGDARNAFSDCGEPHSVGAQAAVSGGANARAWTWFEINYGPLLPRGRLLYVKPSVYRNQTLPVEVQHYWKGSPTFPHETTADQFFSEAQMEAYRSLGQACMDDALGVAVVLAENAKLAPAYDQDPHGLTDVVRRVAILAARPTQPLTEQRR